MTGKKILLVLVSALVLLAIPILLFSEHRQGQIEALVLSENFARDKTTAALIIFGLFSADIFLPVPSSAVCAVAAKVFGFAGGTILCWLGLNLSSLIGFILGRSLGWAAIHRFADEASVVSVKTQVERWGIWPLITFRALPVLAEASILMAGTYRLSSKKFWPAIIMGNLLVSTVFVGLGKWFADQGQFLLGMVVCCVIPPALLLVWSWFNRKTEEQR